MDDDFDIPGAEGMDDDMDLPDESPIMKVGDEKVIGKEGLKKKLVKEGEGWDTPEAGDEVEGKISLYSLLFLLLNSSYFVIISFNSQFIILALCLMGPSSIPVAIGVLLSSSLSVKVRKRNSTF